MAKISSTLLCCPRAEGAGRTSSSTAASSPSWLRVHHGWPPACAAVWTSSSSRKPEPPSWAMSMGASPPIAATDHDASRNSRPVLIRSAARVRTFSGSHTSSGVPAGRWSMSRVSSSGFSTGCSASIPSTGMPSASLASMSPTLPETRFSSATRSASSAPARPGPRRSAGTPGTARRRRCRPRSRNGTLIGHREHPHLGDLVAPELDPHRMFGRRREEVENAAADCEFAAFAHHVDAGVGQLDEPGDQVVEVELRSGVDVAAAAAPARRVTSSIWAMSAAIGCSSERTVVTTTRSGGPSPGRRGGPATQQHQPRAHGVNPGTAARAAASPRTGTAPRHRRTPHAVRR